MRNTWRGKGLEERGRQGERQIEWREKEVARLMEGEGEEERNEEEVGMDR